MLASSYGSDISFEKSARIGPYIWMEKKSSYLHFLGNSVNSYLIDSNTIGKGSSEIVKDPFYLFVIILNAFASPAVMRQHNL